MSITTKTKWGVSIILAGILLALTLIGGNWGTSYAADRGVNAVPRISSIIPDKVPAGSPDKIIVIVGTDFMADSFTTAVRIKGNGMDQILYSALVTSTKIWVTLPSNILETPIAYDISVVMSSTATLPLEVESNTLPFTVWPPIHIYLPFIKK